MFEVVLLRLRVKKFLVVFVGSKLGNDLEMLKKILKFLEDKGVKVVVVVVGLELDFDELIKVVFNKGNLIKVKESFEVLDKLGNEVMIIVFKGKDFCLGLKI